MRIVLPISQILVVLFAIALRFQAGGWWLFILLATPVGWAFLAAVLTPLIAATTLTAGAEPSRLRAWTFVAVVAADLGLLTLAACLPDFTDVADQYLVPIASMATGSPYVSSEASSAFGTAAAVGVGCYVIAVAAAIVLGILARTRKTPVLVPAYS